MVGLVCIIFYLPLQSEKVTAPLSARRSSLILGNIGFASNFELSLFAVPESPTDFALVTSTSSTAEFSWSPVSVWNSDLNDAGYQLNYQSKAGNVTYEPTLIPGPLAHSSEIG